MKQNDVQNQQAGRSAIGCIAGAMEVLSAKWTPLIIKELAVEPHRFSELERTVTGINPRILTQRLEHLERKGVVGVVCGCTSQRPIYELTEKGRDLLPILAGMAKWGSKHKTCCD